MTVLFCFMLPLCLLLLLPLAYLEIGGRWKGLRQEGACSHYLGADNGGILMEGTSRLRFGTNLTEQRRSFMLSALTYLKSIGAASYT